jgi:HlyD family secretion protein
MTDKNKKKKGRAWIWILLAIVIIVGAVLAWRIIVRRQAAAQASANVETVAYERGSLSANIYGTGTVKSSQMAVLTWSASGTVGEIYVDLGDSVAMGEILMALEADSLPIDVLQAQIDVITIQNSLDDLYDNWEAQLAQTKLDLLNAEETLEDLEDERQIMNYERCSDERIEELEEELDNAETIHQFRPSATTLQAVNTAQANLNYCLADYTEEEIAKAELQVELAEARVVELQAEVDLLSDGPDPDQVAILETQLAIAESRLESSQIDAPIDGIVTDLPVQEGDIVQPGSMAVQVDDLSQLHLDVQISEVDIPLVSVGQTAELVFDAYFDTTYTGEVTEIAPIGTAFQGVVEYTVRIALLDADERIKPGMTAAVNIVVEEKEDVFLVPNDAIVVIDGQEHVYVQRNGGYEAVEVTLGGYSGEFSEVVNAAIAEGELIVVNPSAEITGERPFGPPNGGPGGGFRN